MFAPRFVPLALLLCCLFAPACQTGSDAAATSSEGNGDDASPSATLSTTVDGAEPGAAPQSGTDAVSGRGQVASGAQLGGSGAAATGNASPAASAGASGLAADAAPAGQGGAAADAAMPTDGSAGSAAMMEPAVEGADSAAPQSPQLPKVSSTDTDGPFETMQDLATGPSGDSGVFWPSELGKDGVLHPVFVWGCGGGTTPTTYAELMGKIVSHGFVIIAETSRPGDEGAPLAAALDWILAENDRQDSVFFQKLDVSKVGVGGHSIGSANAFLVADDPRLTTSIHVAGGSLDDSGNINAATSGSGGKRLVHPVAYVCSESDQFGNVEKTERDYEQTTAPAWMTVMTGVDHVGAAREGLPAIIAWLRWQLGGEVERQADFLDPSGEYCSGRYVSKNKNW